MLNFVYKKGYIMSPIIDKNITDEEVKFILTGLSNKHSLPFVMTKNSVVKRFADGNQSLPLAVYPDGNDNNEFVVRVPRSQEAIKEMKQDSILSQYLNSHIAKTNIPQVSFIENKEGVFIAIHRSIKGRTMDCIGRADTIHYVNLSEKQKNLLAQDLAVFFNELHQVPIDKNSSLSRSCVKYYDEKSFDMYKEKMKSFGINMENFKTENREDLVCCHNDCHGGNMAFDDKKDHVLQGVFDFGMCGINTRSSDFVKLYQINRELARHTITEYNKISPKKVNIKDVDKQYLAWQVQNLMIAEKLDDKNRQILFTKIKMNLLNFKKDLKKETQDVVILNNDKKIQKSILPIGINLAKVKE